MTGRQRSLLLCSFTLPFPTLDAGKARRLRHNPTAIAKGAVTCVQQLQQAFVEGADYVGVGPVFPSSTKVFQDFPGLSFVEQAAAVAAGPWFAIGGITSERLPELLVAGARRIAVTAAVTQSEPH